MGATLSKAKAVNHVEQINDIITSIIVSNASSCGASSAISQEVLLGNIGGDLSGVDFNIESVVNLDCLQSATNDSQIQSQIAQKLSQYAKSQAEAGTAFLSANVSESISENFSKLSNK